MPRSRSLALIDLFIELWTEREHRVEVDTRAIRVRGGGGGGGGRNFWVDRVWARQCKLNIACSFKTCFSGGTYKTYIGGSVCVCAIFVVAFLGGGGGWV